MEFRNISPLGDLYIPALGLDVAAGETFNVSDDVAESLLEQPTNFEPVKPAKSGAVKDKE